MTTLQLNELCTTFKSDILVNKIEKDTGDYPLFGAKGAMTGLNTYQQSKPYISIIKWGAGVGRAELRPPYSSIVATMLGVLPNDNVDLHWLFYLLQSMHLEQYATNAVVPNLYFKDYCNTSIPVPGLDEQIRISDLLDRVQRIIDTRKQQLSILDDLIKARFVEMFGDPVSNPKGWPMPPIEDVVAGDRNALKAGPFGSALKKEYYVDAGYKIYGQEQVISGDPNYGDYYIDEERYKQLENCAVQAGDVLISLVGTYGKLLIMPNKFEPGIINPRLMKITFDKGKVNPYYFQHFFQSDSLKKALADNTHGGTMDILNLGIVRKIKMPLPPIELQNDFVAFVAQIDKSKAAVQKALDEAQVLFDSLMQQYFG